MKIRKFNEMDTFNITFNSEEEFLNFWSNKWMGTNAESFPKQFVERFPTRDDYDKFEEDEYSYEDEDDEFEFSPDDEVYNIEEEFGITISDDEDGDITTEEWVDFWNSCWSWEKLNEDIDYDIYGLNVVCDKSIFSKVSSHFKSAKIYDREANSSIISTLKTLLSKGSQNITLVIDDSKGNDTYNKQRIDFMREFIGKNDFSKIYIIKSSEI